MAPRRPGGDFKNWNNSLAKNFRPDFRMIYRKIVFDTIQLTHLQDQVLREMIEAGEHLNTSKIVSIDVEYGGARTIPRIAVTNFNDEVLYYSDFCLRYEDWIETKLT